MSWDGKYECQMMIDKTFQLTLSHPTSSERRSDKIISNCCHALWYVFRQRERVLLSFIKFKDVEDWNWAWASSCLETRKKTLAEVFAFIWQTQVSSDLRVLSLL